MPASPSPDRVNAYSTGKVPIGVLIVTFPLAFDAHPKPPLALGRWAAIPCPANPTVRLDANALYIDEGQVLSSAGASAGLDLCLHIVARDYGSAAAADAARLAVTPLHRSGGQAQFIIRNRRMAGAELDGVLVWIENNAHLPLTLRDIARQASSSERTINRRFKKETGHTPMQWVNNVRIRHAQQLLESTGDSIENIARKTGFASSANFRDQFRRLAGVSPQSYRQTFRDRGTGGGD